MALIYVLCIYYNELVLIYVCIKSDVITLESIEMYGFVTVWTSMVDGPYWVILLMTPQNRGCLVDNPSTRGIPLSHIKRPIHE